MESANINDFSIMFDFDLPQAGGFFKTNADIFRRRIFSFLFVTGILRTGGQSQIFASIVEAVTISVVNKKVWRRIHNYSMEGDNFGAIIGFIIETNGVKNTAGVLSCAPIPRIETVIIGRVNDGVFTFAQINPAKWITIFAFSIPHRRPSKETVEPIRYSYVNH